MVYGTTLVIWVVLCFAHYYLRTLGILSGPHDGDLYAYSWSYQAMAFAVVCFPNWILVLGLAYLLEALYFFWKKN